MKRGEVADSSGDIYRIFRDTIARSILIIVDIWCTDKKHLFPLEKSFFDVTRSGPAQPDPTGTLLRSSLLKNHALYGKILSDKKCLLTSLILCIKISSLYLWYIRRYGGFGQGIFFIFSFLRQKFRQYNSRTIRHRYFQFKTLNRSCYRLTQVNIWF